ncbi:MAG: methyltransferase domain-containing protein [Calditrichaeota bacterium]|nr:MAG: methyltransferase domain-containing protein [Calditrichota bacterium]
MQNSDKLKKTVRAKYASIVTQSDKKQKSCCRDLPVENSCCQKSGDDYSVFADDYSKLEGYVTEADLHLGCGIPTEYAAIRTGDTVLDLGSGAGNDVFIARSLAGDKGLIIGVDMTWEMIQKANQNKKKLGFSNVEFRLGEIENLPIESQSVDVVISNCVLNLVPDKVRAFSEIYRVLKPNAHFCVSDIVYLGNMNEKLRRSAEMYAGCVSGALREEEYLTIIKKCGFKNIEIRKKKMIPLPEELLENFAVETEITRFTEKRYGLFSITVTAVKPVYSNKEVTLI